MTTTRSVMARKIAVLIPLLLLSVLLVLVPVCTLSYCRGLMLLLSAVSSLSLSLSLSLAVVYERLPFLSTSINFASLFYGFPAI